MTNQAYYIIAALILAALFPFVPRLIQIRIRLLRWMRINWLADFHQRHLVGIIRAIRVMIAAIAIVLIILAL